MARSDIDEPEFVGERMQSRAGAWSSTQKAKDVFSLS
jgi:hypothetical protein